MYNKSLYNQYLKKSDEELKEITISSRYSSEKKECAQIILSQREIKENKWTRRISYFAIVISIIALFK